MDTDRKRSRGPEEGGAKRPKLEDSPSSEHEILLHATYDDELLSSPVTTDGNTEKELSQTIEVVSRSSRSRSPYPIPEEASGESFPLSKPSKGVGEKRKERRYRGGIDDENEEREREKEKDRRESKRSRRGSPVRERGSKGESLKWSSAGRISPLLWERERGRREERERDRDSRLRHRSAERYKREDIRRGLHQHERDERPYRESYEPRRGDSWDIMAARTRWEDRERDQERFMREGRYGNRSRSDRRERPGRRDWERLGDRQPIRERQPLERGGRRVERERQSRERERHKHKKKRSHKEKAGEELPQKKADKKAAESGSESDVTPHDRKGEQENIDDLIKELQESDSSEESSETSMEEETKKKEEEEEEGEAGGSSGNESDSEHSLSEGSESGQRKEKLTKKRKKLKEENKLSPKEEDVQNIGEPVMKSKFDTDEEEEEEEDTQKPRWYSGYDEVLSGEGSDVSDREDHKGRGDEGPAVEVEPEPERSPTPDLPCYYPALMGCRSVENYEWLNRIEEGTYGVVYRAKDRRTSEIVALKKLKMEKEKEGFPITSLREINMLLKAKHPNIVHVREIVVGSNMDKIYIVMDYVEHDLKALMETMQTNFLESEVKTLMIQLLRAVHHLHDNWILHRDLKASNLLLSHKGILKVGDFGLAREYGSPLKQYTPVVVTLWYRPPELLLGAKEYSTAVDMWSVGCIFAEFMLRKPLFRGKGEIDQLNQIFKELGTPNDEIWPGYSQLPIVQKVTFSKQPYNNLRKRFAYLTNSGFDLLNRFLTYDPKKRITAKDALDHAYFKESPLPAAPHMFPTWPAKSEMSRKPKRDKSPTPPEGGAFLINKRKDDGESPTGFRMTHAQHGQAAVGAGFSLKF